MMRRLDDRIAQEEAELLEAWARLERVCQPSFDVMFGGQAWSGKKVKVKGAIGAV